MTSQLIPKILLWPLGKARMDSYSTFDLEMETDEHTHTHTPPTHIPHEEVYYLYIKAYYLVKDIVHSKEGRTGQSS